LQGLAKKWGWIEVAAAVFPTGCPNSWVLAGLEVIARSCEEKWGWIEVAAAVFPTGSEPDWPQNSWPPLIPEPAGLKVLAGLEVIARGCEGVAREKGTGDRKCEGLVEIAEVEAMADRRLAAKAICFFINLSVKFVKSSTCKGVVSEKGSEVRKCEGQGEAIGDGRLEAKAICFFIKF
jgi:hypothetical protein